MVLVDSSVWIDFFKNQPTREVNVLTELLNNNSVLMCEIVAMEVLRGISDDNQFKRVKHLFENLEQVRVIDPTQWEKGIDWFRFIRKNGYSVRSQMDILLALFCFETRIPILHNDRDFSVIQKFFPFTHF
jgi:predicted nucleic acid-binding protein